MSAPPPLLDPDFRPTGAHAYRACRRRPDWLIPVAIPSAVLGTVVASVVSLEILNAETRYPSLHSALPWPDYALVATALGVLVGWCLLALWGFLRLRVSYGHAAITWLGTLILVDLHQVYLASPSECSPERCSELERSGALRLRLSELEWEVRGHGVLVRPRGGPRFGGWLTWFLIPAPDEASQRRVLALLEQETPAGLAHLREQLEGLARGASGGEQEGGSRTLDA